MKNITLMALLLLLTSCSSYVVVDHDECEHVLGSMYKCEVIQ